MADDPNAPVTRFTAVDVVPEPINLASGNFYSFPNLTQEEIDSIPEDSLEPGIVVYNTTYNVYMAYSAHPTDELLNRWTNINTSLTYKGSGFQAGSPFAIPGGSAVEVEADPQNANPGAMYIDLDTDQPRIFTNDWYDFGPNGTGDSTFTNITVTDTANINNLQVDGTANFTNITVTDTANINNLQVDGTANFTNGLTADVIGTTDLSVTGLAEIEELAVTGNTSLNTLTVSGDTNLSGHNVLTSLEVANLTHLNALNVDAQSNLTGVNITGNTNCATLTSTKLTATQTAVIQNLQVGSEFIQGGICGTVAAGAPLVVTSGTAAGSGASVLLEGTQISGRVTLTTGTGPIGTTILVFTLPNDVWQLYSAPFGVIITPANTATYIDANTATVTAALGSVSNISTSAIVRLSSGAGTPLPPSTSYVWNYIFIGNSLTII